MSPNSHGTTRKADLLRSAINAVEEDLESATGLGPTERRTVAYYTANTHRLADVDSCPLLVIRGPAASGKSSTLRVIKKFARQPRLLSAEQVRYPAFRDFLGICHGGTAIVEEADLGIDADRIEPLLKNRYDSDTAVAAKKELDKEGKWITIETPFFGATVLHKRIPFQDHATESRAITVFTKLVVGREFMPPAEKLEGDLQDTLKTFRRLVPEVPRAFKPPHGMSILPRIVDTYSPLLGLASFCGDEEFISATLTAMERESEKLREGADDEPQAAVFSRLVAALWGGEEEGPLKLRPVKIDDDIVMPLQRISRSTVSARQAASLLRELGLEVKKSGGVNRVYQTRKTLLDAYDQIGVMDEVVEKFRADPPEESAPSPLPRLPRGSEDLVH